VKVMLETRCGCKRSIWIDHVAPRIVIPLYGRPRLGPMSQEERERPAPVELRTFDYAGDLDGLHFYQERA
jgi:hypothetical protein